MSLLTSLLAPGSRTSFAYVVEHGADNTVTRPVFGGVVFWIGSVDPDNAEASDVVLNSTGAGGRLWLPPGRFVAGAGTPIEALANNWPVWSLPDAAATAIHTVVSGMDIPGWATFDVDVWWTNLGAAVGNVRLLQYAFTPIGDGTALANPTNTGQLTATAPAQNVLEVTTLVSGMTAPAVDQAALLKVGRSGSDGLDSLTNAAGIVGVMLRQAS